MLSDDPRIISALRAQGLRAFPVTIRSKKSLKTLELLLNEDASADWQPIADLPTVPYRTIYVLFHDRTNSIDSIIFEDKGEMQRQYLGAPIAEKRQDRYCELFGVANCAETIGRIKDEERKDFVDLDRRETMPFYNADNDARCALSRCLKSADECLRGFGSNWAT